MSVAALILGPGDLLDAQPRSGVSAVGCSNDAGYATAARRRALALAGPCPYHRRSFRLSEDADEQRRDPAKGR